VIESIWNSFLDIVRQEAGSRVVETWLKAVSLDKWDFINKTAYIQAPNSFIKDWICTNYLNIFEVHLKRLFNVDSIKIIFFVEKLETSFIKNSNDNNIIPAKLENHSNNMPSQNIIKSHVNSSYIFDSFIVGPNNSLAYAAARAVSKKPGILYNPLFIYGDSGLGKTHLLHAIGNEIKLYNKNISILYQTTDRFVNEFINAIRFDKIHTFKSKYQRVDVLLIDDVQFISNKDQTQEAFFHIFNNLHESSKQIVFSGDNYPGNIKGIEERLRSRFEWGLVTDIHAPTLETKVAILKRKASSTNEIISDDVIYFIASKIDSNIRELEGALIRVLAFASLTNQEICLELAKKVLNNSKNSQEKTISLDSIAKIISKHYSFNVSELQSKSQTKQISFVRQVAMYLMKQKTMKSLQDIGAFFNRRDHTTVSYAIDKIHKMRETDKEFNIKIKQLEYELNN